MLYNCTKNKINSREKFLSTDEKVDHFHYFPEMFSWLNQHDVKVECFFFCLEEVTNYKGPYKQ